MRNIKDLTDFLSYLQTLQKPQAPDFPCFALSASFKSNKTLFFDSLLGFPLFPATFSHKLRSIELILRTSPDTSSNGYLIELKNKNEKFTCIETFQSRIHQYISSECIQDYTETVTIQISSGQLPSLTIIDLPVLENEQFITEGDQIPRFESLKKKIVKKTLQNLNNLILCILGPEDDLDNSKPLDYLRQYDPHGVRSLLVFTNSGTSIQGGIRKQDIEKTLTEGEFPRKHGFLCLDETRINGNYGESFLEEGQDGDKEPERVKGLKSVFRNRENLLLKLKEVAQYSVRGVFPGLLEELQSIGKDLQTRLNIVNEEGVRKGYNIKIEGPKAVSDVGTNMLQDFYEEVLCQENVTNRENRAVRKRTVDLENSKEIDSAKSSSSRKTSSENDFLVSPVSREAVGRFEDSEYLEEVPCGARIAEMFNNLYKDENYKANAASFANLSDDEIKAVFQTSNPRNVPGFIKSQGFKAVVSSRLQWLFDSTFESVWSIHEAVSSTMLKNIDKHFIRFPTVKTTLRQNFKGFFQDTREATVQALRPVLNSYINFVYLKDPYKVFGELYESQSDKIPRKNSLKTQNLVTLIQQLCETSRIYCEYIVESLKECIPRMIGQLYISEIIQKSKVKFNECIESLSGQDPDTFKAIDPLQEERDALERKLKMVQKGKDFMLQDHSLQTVILVEDSETGAVINEGTEKSLENETCETFDDLEENKKINEMKESKSTTGKDKTETRRFLNEKLRLQTEHIKNIKSYCSNEEEFMTEDEYEVLKGVIDNLQFKKGELGTNVAEDLQTPIVTPMVESSCGDSNMPENEQANIEEEGEDEEKCDQESSITNFQQESCQSSDTSMLTNGKANNVANVDKYPQLSVEIAFRGLEIIKDYCTRRQKFEDKVLSQREWFGAIQQDSSLTSIDETRLLISAYYGIHKDIRGSVWMFLAGVKELKSRYAKGYYEDLCSRLSTWEYVIEKDIPRTLVEEPFFYDPEYKGGEKLKRILTAYANFDPELGYTQGMNTVAGIILMVLCGYSPNTKPKKYKRLPKSCERNAFWILVYIMKEKGYRASFLDSYPRVMENLTNFEKTLNQKSPKVLEHLKKHGISVESAFMHQFMTIGGQHGPLELFVRVMDVFLLKGEDVVVEMILNALEICKEQILSAKDDKLFRFLKHDILYLAFDKCKGDINRLLVLEA